MANAHLHVLMLEEDSDDRAFTREGIEELGFPISIHFFSEVDELFHFLAITESPSLILVDYNLSAESGLDVLKKLKADNRYKHFPVVVLSESVLDKYVRECYAHGANTFIKKPSTLNGTKRTIETFLRYWYEVAEL